MNSTRMQWTRHFPLLSRSYLTTTVKKTTLNPSSIIPFSEPQKSEFAQQFIGCIMRNGKKDITTRLYTNILKQLQMSTSPPMDPRNILMTAMEHASPVVKNKKSFRGKKMIQIPTPLPDRPRRRHAIMWIRELVESKKSEEKDGMAGASLYAKEVLKILDGSSSVLVKRDAIHKSCLAQKSNIRMFAAPVAFKF